jgi:hypothetical protein
MKDQSAQRDMPAFRKFLRRILTKRSGRKDRSN